MALLKPLLKPLIAVSLALLLSLAGNVWQLQRHAQAVGVAEGQRTAAGELGRAVGEVEALRETAERAATVADGAAQEFADVSADIVAIAQASRKQQVVYRDRIKEVPAATCAPGAERMDAFNAALGAD